MLYSISLIVNLVLLIDCKTLSEQLCQKNSDDGKTKSKIQDSLNQNQLAFRKNISQENAKILASEQLQKRLLTSSVKNISNNNLNCTIQPYNTQTTINLGNCEQQLYYITIGIGTPPQYFNFQVDTGSNQLWVPTIINSPNGYNSNASLTFLNTSQPYTQDYINGGRVSGSIGTDFLTLVNTSINVSCNIVFADQVSGLNLPDGVAGVLGLGYTSIYASPNFLDSAMAAGQIQSNTFALNLLNSSQNSMLLYNQIPQQISNYTYSSNVVDSFYWQVQVIGVIAGLTDLTQYAAKVAVIDSGTSLFYLNPQLTSAFISRFLPPTECNFTQGLNICNCSILSSLPDVTFIFVGVAVKLTPNDYVQAFGSTCYVHIYSVSTNPPQILLGDTLFMQYVVTYSKEQQNIGFWGDTQQVYTFGNQRNFIELQYVILGLAVLLFVYAVILIAIMSNKRTKNTKINKSKKNVNDTNSAQNSALKQRMTEMFQQKNNLEIQIDGKNKPMQQMKQMS